MAGHRAIGGTLGGSGGEILGGVWFLLMSVVALRAKKLPRALNWLGAGLGAAGILSAVPALSGTGFERPRSGVWPSRDRVVLLARARHIADQAGRLAYDWCAPRARSNKGIARTRLVGDPSDGFEGHIP